MTTITFTVRCACCQKRSDEFAVDYDMEDGTDDGLKATQEAMVLDHGEWIHVPAIKDRDTHVCTTCAGLIAARGIVHVSTLYRRVTGKAGG